MRVLVCGGRDYADKPRVFKTLDAIHAKHGIECIIEGRCPYGGADKHAQDWAELRGVPNEGYPMESGIGPRAGPERNARMLREGKPDVGVAFPGGRGTADMANKMERHGYFVWRIE